MKDKGRIFSDPEIDRLYKEMRKKVMASKCEVTLD
jgi:hypothetical protein